MHIILCTSRTDGENEYGDIYVCRGKRSRRSNHANTFGDQAMIIFGLELHEMMCFYASYNVN